MSPNNGFENIENAPFWAILGQLMRLIPGKPLEPWIRKKFSRLLVHGHWAITIGTKLVS